jgi:hypothetical protein
VFSVYGLLPNVVCAMSIAVVHAESSASFLSQYAAIILWDVAGYVCRTCLQRVLAANRQPLYCTLRTRKRCAVLNSAGDLLRVHHILNECVIDR